MHSWTALGAAVAIHQRTVDRLVQRVYDQPLINNAERGAYVEHMIALALKGKGWDLTWPWASWDLEYLRWPEEKRPRIEVKQSAARGARGDSAVQRAAIESPSHHPEHPPGSPHSSPGRGRAGRYHGNRSRPLGVEALPRGFHRGRIPRGGG